MQKRDFNPTRRYFSHSFDSSRWSKITLRDDDIIVATAPKSGTTWTQRIIAVLIHGEHLPQPLGTLCPWIDCRFVPEPMDAVAARVAAQPYRRSLKSHLPFDALPYHPEVKYICVGRDGRDVALSAHNHYSGFTDTALDWLNSPPGTFTYRFERAPADIHFYLKDWLTRGNPNFSWETQGYPGLSNLRQVQSFWDYRHLPNVLLTHYDDLQTHFEAEVSRIAAFVDIEANPETLRFVKKYCSFEAMKRESMETAPQMGNVLEGGAERFYNKGVSGRWKDVFTKEELELYEAAVHRNLSPDCAAWLEQGRKALPA